MTASRVTPTSSFVPRSDLDLLLYGASPGQAVRRFFEKYATFRGRASLPEFWWAILMVDDVYIPGWIITGILFYVLDPRGRRGLILSHLIWLLGSIALLVLFCLPSNPSSQHDPGPETIGAVGHPSAP